jgi:NitT/TauT family transport system permease protein
VGDWSTLYGSLLITLKITFMALAAAVSVGVALAVLFTQSKWLREVALPYAVVLQVTPVVAIAPSSSSG